MVTGCAYLLAAGLTTHQDYVAYRLRVSADVALFVLLMLVFPSWYLKELQDKAADQVRKRVDRALTGARESVSTTAS
ncbi:hypothetical protein [Streptomyces chartreusis]|uniref:hypothetical protein n=1 Tax=Streptomyces chartreusis TaxID=1969 RepID=UPI002F90C87C|nr:hypothetical protein OG938_44060 [Streptomyces chartreusis]WSZ73468.1 hypothetical protein OG938_47735 [Streptomyces chartreusis]